MRLSARGMFSGTPRGRGKVAWIFQLLCQWGDSISHKGTVHAWLGVWSALTRIQWAPGTSDPCHRHSSPLPLLSRVW